MNDEATCSGHCYSLTESGAGYIDPACPKHGREADPGTSCPPLGTKHQGEPGASRNRLANRVTWDGDPKP